MTSATEYTAFDILGRVTAAKQTTDGNDYTTGYTYNLSGALIEETYPSGRVVKNTLDNDGSLNQVQSKRSGATYLNYANGFTFNASGAVEKMRLGNGLWETTQFNSRLQPTQIGLGLGSTTPNKLKLGYEYGATASVNNGNITKQTITVPGVAYPFVQAYTYDELNRLADATETQNSSQTWKQTFTYDRYGNRNFNTSGSNTTTLPSGFDPDIYNPTISTTNNRFSSGQGYSYDSSGNTTADAEGRTFVYDAENKQIEVIDNNVTVGQYFYDGDGRRVKKIVPGGETTIFVYDTSGRLIQEHSTVVQSGDDARIVYTTNDSLGSPRINTDAIGAVISRHDYRPFGDEVTRSGYGSDTIRKQFTSYERDTETDLDFAQARYFASSLGRFSTPDSFTNDTSPGSPQKWNLYSYVQNNPLNRVDVDGKKGRILWTTDENGVTHVTVQASFAMYAANGQNISKKDLKKYRDAMLNGIEKRLNKKFDVEGKKFSLSADITIDVKNSKEKAITSGADNIIEIGTADLVSQYPETDSTAGGVGFGIKGENFDRMAMEIEPEWDSYRGSYDPVDNAGSVFTHEVMAHLMAVFHSEDSDSVLYESDLSRGNFLQADFENMFFGRSNSDPIPTPAVGKPRVERPPLTQGMASSGKREVQSFQRFSSPSEVFGWQARTRQ